MLTGKPPTNCNPPTAPVNESAPFLVQRDNGIIEEHTIYRFDWIVKENGYFYCVSNAVFEKNFKNLRDLASQ